MTNLTELLAQWIGQEKSSQYKEKHTLGDELVWTFEDGYNQALKDLKSRIPDLERQIRAELLKELQSNKSIGDVLAALRDGND